MPTIFPRSKVRYCYSAAIGPGAEPEIIFGAYSLSKRRSNRSFDQTVNSSMLAIGGDDKHFSKEADLIVEGLHGREFVYDKGDASGRAVFLNAGNRVYFVLYRVEGDLVSPNLVNRVFDSFRPLRIR